MEEQSAKDQCDNSVEVVLDERVVQRLHNRSQTNEAHSQTIERLLDTAQKKYDLSELVRQIQMCYVDIAGISVKMLPTIENCERFTLTVHTPDIENVRETVSFFADGEDSIALGDCLVPDHCEVRATTRAPRSPYMNECSLLFVREDMLGLDTLSLEDGIEQLYADIEPFY